MLITTVRPAELIAKATEMEVKGFDFLDILGQHSRRPMFVRVTFQDDVVMHVSYKDFCGPQLQAFEFKLRPQKDH